jgi:hypothetical protein
LLEEIWGWRPRCVLVASTGGGGDAGSAAVLAEALRRMGARVVLAALPWERFVVDPLPGPVPLKLFRGVELLGSGLAARAALRGGCWAVRGGRLLVPAACRAAEALPWLPVYLLEGWVGPGGAARGLGEVAGIHGCEAVAVFDVGGDVLACGCEEGLWSPLADAVGLAAGLEAGLDAVVAVHSPGADGELNEEEVLRYAAMAAARGGYRWLRGLSRLDAPVVEEVLSRVYTEAGRPQLEALRGRYGWARIRGGTRRVRVSLVQATTLFLDARVVASWAAGGRLLGAWGLEEARRRLNEIGVYTELDLEEDVALFAAREGRPPGPEELAGIRSEGRRRLAPCTACGPGLGIYT